MESKLAEKVIKIISENLNNDEVFNQTLLYEMLKLC